ncbi:MAG: hypothetical protein EOM73_10090 [Bacteroidia bacterium]|nr:hypothetical protein [Bacteroidia bacterium]
MFSAGWAGSCLFGKGNPNLSNPACLCHSLSVELVIGTSSRLQNLICDIPDCLNLVQQNYDTGAFLSGDGDLSRDLEYTFYGLLTLGTL